MNRNILTVEVDCCTAGLMEQQNDLIAVEEPLQISIAGQNFAIAMRTPGSDRELAAGLLVTEGILRHPSQMVSLEQINDAAINFVLAPGIHLDPERFARNFYLNSSCGICGKASIEALKEIGCPDLARDRPIVAPSLVESLPGRLRSGQAVFDRTGGLHAAGIVDADTGEVLFLREDVGRHNAVDKVIGAAFLAGLLPLDRHILILSGRVSFELVQKALMGGIAFVAAIGAPSSLAVDAARRFGMTVAGFVRDGRFNIYSGAWRVNQ